MHLQALIVKWKFSALKTWDYQESAYNFRKFIMKYAVNMNDSAQDGSFLGVPLVLSLQ